MATRSWKKPVDPSASSERLAMSTTLAAAAIITFLVFLPSLVRGPRYRPGLGWWAAPVWFNGPEDADNAVRTATATVQGGGASARW